LGFGVHTEAEVKATFVGKFLFRVGFETLRSGTRSVCSGKVLIDLNSLALQSGQEIVDLLRGMHICGQTIVDLIVEQVAALFTDEDELLNVAKLVFNASRQKFS
jgi:hypothetical protein